MEYEKDETTKIDDIGNKVSFDMLIYSSYCDNDEKF